MPGALLALFEGAVQADDLVETAEQAAVDAQAQRFEHGVAEQRADRGDQREAERAEQMERVLALESRNLRTQPLRALTTEPYALLVATRDSREAATKILPELADLPGDPLVIEWRDEAESPARFDVYLAGFRDIAALGNEAAKLRERGFTPRLEIAGDPVP